MGRHDDLAEVWRRFAATEATGYSPLYAAIVDAAAEDDEILGLVASAPARSHYPLMLLAAVHDLVLRGGLPELAAVYRGDGSVDAAPPLFRAAVFDHRDHVLDVLARRSIQTNEVGRAAPLALGLAMATAAVGELDALIDAGASAGLNLFYDRFRLELGDEAVWGDPASPVICACAMTGSAPVPLRFADVPVRIGLDLTPIDVTDPAAARWLLACTWPDTGRLERTRAAIEIATASPPDVRTGDLVADIGPLLDGLDGDGPVCVTTSWVLGWLDLEQRQGFVAALADAASARPVAWVSLEHPGIAPGIDAVDAPTTHTNATSLVGLTTFAPGGITSPRPLAHVHPHGSALEWIT